MRKFIGAVLYTLCGAVSMITSFSHAQLTELSAYITRYEFTEALEQAQCRDCLVPPLDMKEKYVSSRLEQQQKDPQKALDDITVGEAWRENKSYYYCVASVVDAGIMNGFPRTTSPYCPGKFCGSSFLTVAELLESLVRLIGPQVRKQYPINRKEVALRAKDAPSVTLMQRTRVAQALRRCPDAACEAEHAEEFDLWLRRCTLDLGRCNFVPYGTFTQEVPQTPKLNVLINAGVFAKETKLGNRFDLVQRTTIDTVLGNLEQIISCETSGKTDYDSDGIMNREDVCPYIYDMLQNDLDKDGIGDVCDDDVDGDGIKNEIGVLDAGGSLVPKLALLSTDNCILLQNSTQENGDSDVMGNVCDADTLDFVSNFAALQVDAVPYRGNAPLPVEFSQKNIGLVGLLERDFGDGVIQPALAPTHLFTKAGLYLVKATASIQNNELISMVPIEVLPDLRIQAGLEVLSKDLVTEVGKPITLQHVGIGYIQKLTVRATGIDETIDLKESVAITIQEPGVHHIELQAYNSVGQWVALSQFTVDLSKQLGSQVHASSLDPLVGAEVDFTTIMGGFSEDEVYTTIWDFGDGTLGNTGGLVAAHAWQMPGVYLVKQTIQFRDRSRADHENILTLMVRGDDLGRKVHLSVDELQKSTGEPFVFTLETENFPVQDIRSCTRTFTPTEFRKSIPPVAKDLVQTFAYGTPGSYPVFVLCQATTNQWYHAAVTVAVEQGSVCLQEESQLSCDLDKDGIPDLCDDDIDGDGVVNLMNLLTKELPNCRIDSGNINQEILTITTQACASGAALDNCSFVKNPNQEDVDGNGIGAACFGDAGTTVGGSTAGGTTAGGTGSSAGGSTAGGDQSGSATAGSTSAGDADGDGIGDATDACGSTPESANGNSDADGCPEAPEDESDDNEIPDNPLVEVDSCTQCPCPEADYASSLRKGDRVRALLLDEAGSIIYKYTKPEIIQEDIPSKMLGQ